MNSSDMFYLKTTQWKIKTWRVKQRLSEFLVQMWRLVQTDGGALSHLVRKVKKPWMAALCHYSPDYKELRLDTRSRFHVWGNPRHSLYHLTDRCQRNQRQPIMLILPVIMCDDPAVTRSCGKYVHQYCRRGQMHQRTPAHAYHLPPNPSLLNSPPPAS